MVCVSLAHLTVHPILMPDKIAVPDEGAPANVALVGGAGGVGANVNRKLTL